MFEDYIWYLCGGCGSLSGATALFSEWDANERWCEECEAEWVGLVAAPDGEARYVGDRRVEVVGALITAERFGARAPGQASAWD